MKSKPKRTRKEKESRTATKTSSENHEPKQWEDDSIAVEEDPMEAEVRTEAEETKAKEAMQAEVDRKAALKGRR